jgi:hypothetical protein
MTSDDLVSEAQDPATTADRLQELAAADPATWPAIAVHPRAYDGLLQWIGTHGDESLRATIAARAADAPTQVVPPVEPAPVDPAGVEHTSVMPAYGAAPDGSDPTDATAPVPTEPAAQGTGHRSTWLLAGMIAVVLVLIGGVAYGATQVLGDDDPERATASTTSPAPTTPAPTSPTPSPTGATAPPSSGDDFCDAMKTVTDPSLAGLGSGVAPEDLGDVQDLAARMRQAYDELEASAPDEIKADVAVMGSFIDALSDPTGSGLTNMTENAEKYGQAVSRVGQYYAQTCF